MNALRFLPVVAVALALHVPARAQQKEDSKLVIDIPAAVQATIQKEKGDGKVVEFRRANDNDGTTYVVILLLDGKNYALSLDAAGRVISKMLDEDREEPKPLALDDLPANIKKTFLREAGGAAVKAVEVKQEKKSYAAEIVVGNRRYIIEIDADGKLIRKQHAGDADGR
jgi:uncharacterized membrane protein YkoI